MTPQEPLTNLERSVVIEQSLTTAGQRKVNLIWEYTQSFLAVVVVTSNVLVWVTASLRGSTANIPEGLVGLCGMVIGFYFSRTNHAAVGGVGPKPQSEYRGR